MENYDVALNKYVAVYSHTYNVMVGCFLAACRENVEKFVWQKAYDDLDEYIDCHGILSCSSYYDYLEKEGLEDEPASQAMYEEYLSKQIHYVVKEFNPDNEAHQDILSECNYEWYEV